MSAMLQGRRAVVTGGGRGIGRAVALALAAEGAKVLVNDPGVTMAGDGSDRSPADAVVAEIKELGGVAEANYDSVADFQAAGKIIQSCLDYFGGIEILANHHGINRFGMSWEIPFEDWDAMIKVHLYGTFNTCRHAIPIMREQKFGRIINTTSGAWKGMSGNCHYGAAKGGIVSLTASLAREMGPWGGTCNAISPVANTRMLISDVLEKRVKAGVTTQEEYERYQSMPGPEFVAPIVAYLATEYAADVNGAILNCKGGDIGINSEPVEIHSLHKDYKKSGPWTIDELMNLVPQTILTGYANPAPRKEEGKI